MQRRKNTGRRHNCCSPFSAKLKCGDGRAVMEALADCGSIDAEMEEVSSEMEVTAGVRETEALPVDFNEKLFHRLVVRCLWPLFVHGNSMLLCMEIWEELKYNFDIGMTGKTEFDEVKQCKIQKLKKQCLGTHGMDVNRKIFRHRTNKMC